MPDFADIPSSAVPVDSDGRPNFVRPLVHHSGWSMPYRGYAAHGVDPNGSAPESHNDIFDQGEAPVYEEAEPERATVPVPVRIVNEGSKENKEFVTGSEVASAVPSMIAGRNENRTGLTIKNIGTVRIWIGNDNRVSPAIGYPLDPNENTSITGWGSVWAVSNDGTNQPVAVLAQYVVER